MKLKSYILLFVSSLLVAGCGALPQEEQLGLDLTDALKIQVDMNCAPAAQPPFACTNPNFGRGQGQGQIPTSLFSNPASLTATAYAKFGSEFKQLTQISQTQQGMFNGAAVLQIDLFDQQTHVSRVLIDQRGAVLIEAIMAGNAQAGTQGSPTLASQLAALENAGTPFLSPILEVYYDFTSGSQI